MSLTTEMPSAVRYLIPGVVGGTAAFVFSRLLIEPLISAAVGYEAALEHVEAHDIGGGHHHAEELFSRSVQGNLGAAVGVIGFGIVMGVLFAIAFGVIRTVLEQHRATTSSTGSALLLAAGMFVATALMPGLKYPANPPGVGWDETLAERTSSSLTMTVISVLGAVVAFASALVWSRRWTVWRATAAAVTGYVAVMLAAMVLLPSFHEVPDGFPAEVLAEFRLYSLVSQAVMWAVIGAVWAGLSARWPSTQRAQPAEREPVS